MNITNDNFITHINNNSIIDLNNSTIANINAPISNDGMTPLHHVTDKNKLDVVGWLLTKSTLNPNIIIIDKNGFTPLGLAIRTQSLEVVKTLLDLNKNVSTYVAGSDVASMSKDPVKICNREGQIRNY